MNFRETLGRHLLTIETRDLETLAAKPVEIYENGGLGVAVLHLDYREDAKRSESYLTLVFENRGGEWLMVQDQNTPIR